MSSISTLPVDGSAAQPGLAASLQRWVVGQPAAIAAIVPYIEMYQANLAPPGRPVGVFLLLGPTGTGKTHTVESLAQVLHGSPKKLLKIDCGEFQLDHEVAKLIGAPPGYLGHRETHPMITQQKLQAVTSPNSDLSIVLFDEVEKAAPSLVQLLLGVLDKAILHLGDNTTVNFERSLIFLTSNAGAREIQDLLRPRFGFERGCAFEPRELEAKLDRAGRHAIEKRFPPEFVNRIDVIVTYRPLSEESLRAILDQQLDAFQQHIHERLGERAFVLDVCEESRQFLLRRGTSPEYGARELKRVIHRHVIQPVASLVARGQVRPGATVAVRYCREQDCLEILPGQRKARGRATAPVTARLSVQKGPANEGDASLAYVRVPA